MVNGKEKWTGGASRADVDNAFRLAIEGLSRGDMGKLGEAAALGWNPSMPGKWWGRAMEEPSGAAMRWLLDRFPLDCALSPLVNMTSDQDGGDWSAPAMLAMQECAAEFGDIAAWIAACMGSRSAGGYFEASLSTGPMWAEAMSGKGLPGPGALIEIMCQPALHRGDERTIEACVAFCAAMMADSSALTGDGREKAIASAGRVVLFAMGRGRPLSLLGPLLSCLPDWMLRMGGSPIEAPMGPGGRRERQVSRALSDLAGLRGGRVSASQDGGWELGAYALLGTLEDFELALGKGWIKPVMVRVGQKCENPDFIALDEARAAERLGRAIDTSKRWAKCAEAIEDSSLPAARKADLLAKIAKPDSAAWSEGDAKVFDVTRDKASSPLALLLAMNAGSKRSKDVQAKAERLWEAGFRIKDALSAADPLSSMAAAGVMGQAWAARLAEREELAQAARPAHARSRRMSL